MLTKTTAFLLLILLIPLFISISILVFIVDGPPVFFVQKRVGVNSTNFNLYKFRTMKMGVPNIATRLLESPEKHITKSGRILRKLCLDELPNLINIIRGDMCFVGPRPVLESEKELVGLRKNFGVDKLLPGLTGLAQINERGDPSPKTKVKYELEYANNRSLALDINIILKTIRYVFLKRIFFH